MSDLTLLMVAVAAVASAVMAILGTFLNRPLWRRQRLLAVGSLIGSPALAYFFWRGLHNEGQTIQELRNWSSLVSSGLVFLLMIGAIASTFTFIGNLADRRQARKTSS